jgi:hypothetical protein
VNVYFLVLTLGWGSRIQASSAALGDSFQKIRGSLVVIITLMRGAILQATTTAPEDSNQTIRDNLV